ncbi:MAG: carboxypeptidase regulatory-like domain-containing protein, partial [Planctomycetota bacterium]
MTTIRLLCLIVLCLGVCPTPAAARDDLDCRVDDSLGRPLAGAHVSVFRSENQAFSTQSNAEGRFTIPDLGEENARIHVGKDGYTTAVESYWPDYDLRPTRYRLYEARSIIGRVLDENGQPLPAAGVIGFTEAGIDFSWPESDCDANGAFRLDGLPIGLVWVNAFLPGYEPVHSGPYSIETESIEIRLTPKPSGNFRFVAKEVGSGEPIEGVDVSLTLDPEVGSRYFRLPRRFATQSTNADGVALIEGLPAGNYHVSIDHSELTIQPNELHYEPLLAGETRTISLGDAPSDSETIDLQGRVLLDDEPLVGVEVHAHTSPVFQRGPSAVTDAEGRFLLTAPYVPGKPLYAGLAGREYSAILPDGLDNAVKLTSVEPDREVTIVAARSATVVVRATSTNGQPLAGVSATLEGGTHHGWSYPYVTWGETDDAGLLRLDGLAPSDPPARLQLSYGDEEQKWPNRLTWSEGETVEDIVVQFADKASISGIVRDETGRPYPGVWVFAGETTMTDRSGRFAISGLAAGKREAWLSIDEADDIHKAAYTLELEPGQEVDNLEWVLPRNAPDVIEGMVFTSNGQPVRSYSLHVDAGKDDARHVEGDESGFQITELS